MTPSKRQSPVLLPRFMTSNRLDAQKREEGSLIKQNYTPPRPVPDVTDTREILICFCRNGPGDHENGVSKLLTADVNEIRISLP